MRHGFRMSVGAHPDGVRRLNAAFAEFAQTHAVPDAVRRSLSIALDELLANELSHGMMDKGNVMLTLDARLDEDRVTVTLIDNGPAFDPFEQAEPDTTLSVEDRPIGGLGIHLVRKMIDEVSYERRDENNVVVLVKQLNDVKKQDLPEAG